MDWFQVLFLFFANASLIVWFRTESRSDWRHTDAKMETHIKTIHDKIDANQKETNAIIRSIQDEMKEFHGRMERQDAEFKQHMMYYHAKERKD